MTTGEEFARDLAEHNDAQQAAGVRQERKSSRRERIITWVVVLLALGWAYNAWSNAQLDAAAEAAEVGAQQRQEEIDQAFDERDAASAARGEQLEEILAQQQSYGKAVTAADLAAAIGAVETTDPALQSTLTLLADQVAELEAAAPKAGPKGDKGDTGEQGEQGEPGTGAPGQPGQDGTDGLNGANGNTPSVTAGLVDGHLIITIDGAPYDLGSIVGPKGDTGNKGDKGDKGDPGSAQAGTYTCPSGQYVSGITVASSGTVTLTCVALPTTEPAPPTDEPPTEPTEEGQ